MRFAFTYLNYLWCSVSRYRIHSPFMYHLVSHVLRAKPPQNIIALPEDTRLELTKNKARIKVLDLGEGGKFNPIRYRNVGTIASSSSKRPAEGRLLYNLVAHFQPKLILELGTSLGISTMYLRLANPQSRIITIEGCPETAKLALGNFEKHGLTGIEVFNGNFEDVLPELIRNGIKPDMVFVDGNHGLDATIRYFELLAPLMPTEGFMVFDDIHWSKGMEQAWGYIQRSETTQVTVDVYSMGLVFFKKGLSKQNFTILL